MKLRIEVVAVLFLEILMKVFQISNNQYQFRAVIQFVTRVLCQLDLFSTHGCRPGVNFVFFQNSIGFDYEAEQPLSLVFSFCFHVPVCGIVWFVCFSRCCGFVGVAGVALDVCFDQKQPYSCLFDPNVK